MSMNQVLVCGRLTSDPTLRDVNGVACLSFGLATDTELKDENGKYTPMFYSVTVWRANAERCAKFLHKGEKVFVSGNLSQRTYVDNAGLSKQQNRITAHTVEFMGGKRQQTDEAVPPSATSTTQSASADPNDELPF